MEATEATDDLFGMATTDLSLILTYWSWREQRQLSNKKYEQARAMAAVYDLLR